MADQLNGSATRASPEPIPEQDLASSTPPPPPTTAKKLNRQRSSSLQKGAAVLRALSRAESDFDRQHILLAASGSDPAAATVPPQDAATPSSPSAADGGLRKRSTATTTSHPSVQPDRKRDRVNATALPTSQPTSKSWEIPRKLFHSSIGGLVLYLYLSHTDLHLIVRNLSYFLGVVVTADVIRLNNADFEHLYERVLGFLMRESEKEKVNGVVWYLVGVITSLHFFPEDIACVSIMILSWCDTCASTFGRLLGRYTPPLPSPPFARRKSTAGFLAAIISGAMTSYLFWCTPILFRGERAGGISWSGSGSAHPAIFGTDRVVGTTGWRGWRTGFVGQSGVGLLPSLSSAGGGGADVPGMPVWMLTLGSGLVAGVAEGLELGGVDDNLSLPILSAGGIWAMLWAWGRAAGAWMKVVG